jgi:hypothetical protein
MNQYEREHGIIATWSRDKHTFHVDFTSAAIVYHHVFTLPMAEDVKNWHSHFTTTGLQAVLLDLCCNICHIMKKIKLIPGIDRQEYLSHLWEEWPLGHHQLCPRFEIVNCFVTKVLPKLPPSRTLHCTTLLQRELLLDAIIKQGDDTLKVEILFKLGKKWLDQIIWNHKVLRTIFPIEFVSRLKNH